MTNPKYLAGLLMALPVFPVMWLQGKYILNTMPTLDETRDREGCTGKGDNPLKIIAVGESTIAGVGARSGEYALVGRTAEYLAGVLQRPIHWRAVARSGLTIRKVCDELLSGEVSDSADLIIAGIGANDVFKLNHPSGFERDLTDFINLLKLKFQDVPVVFVHMPPINDLPIWTDLLRFFMGGLSDILEEILRSVAAGHEEVYYCEDPITLDKFRQKVNRPSTTDEFFSDGVHPSELTYQLWGEEVGAFICEKVLTEI